MASWKYTGVLQKVPNDQPSTLMRSVYSLGGSILVDGADQVGRLILPRYVGQEVSLEGKFFGLEGQRILTVTRINNVPVEKLLYPVVDPPPIKEIPFGEVYRDNYFGLGGEAEGVIRNQKELFRFLQKNGGEGEPPLELKEGKVWIAVLDDTHPTGGGGYSIAIRKIEVRPGPADKPEVVVYVEHITPGLGPFFTMVISRPVHIVEVDANLIGNLPIRFEHIKEDDRNRNQEAKVRELVQSDLVNSFGLDPESIESLIKEGKIKIEVDLEKQSAKVTIDPSVELPSLIHGDAPLVSPLGLEELPEMIEYRFGEEIVYCVRAPCPTFPILESGVFTVGVHDYELRYVSLVADTPSEAFLQSVVVLEHDPVMRCVRAPCGRLVEEISFEHTSEGKISARIVYHEQSQGDTASRTVLFEKMEDGQYHIKTVEEYDQEGNLLVRNEFQYLTASVDTLCLPGPGKSCPPRDVTVHLVRILRTDSEGNILSTISRFKSGFKRVRDPIGDMPFIPIIPILTGESIVTARVNLADGTEANVSFSTLEDLFEEVRKIEARPKLPPAVQEFVDHLRQGLGDAYVVKVERALIAIYPPHFIVEIRAKGTSRQPQVEAGHLASVSFTLLGDKFQPWYFSVQYGEMPLLKGEMLYRGLQILASAPEAEPWAPIILMTQITLTRVDEDGTIHFVHEGKEWRVVRNADGNISLEEEGIETVRKKLLSKTESEIEGATQEIQILVQKIKEAEIRWLEEAGKFNGEIAEELVPALRNLISELEEISKRDGLSDETLAGIKELVGAVNHYLQEELSKEQDLYLGVIRMVMVGILEMEKEALDEYLANLQAYREEVLSAETLEALEELANQFPKRRPVPISLIALPPDPREQLKTYLEKGNALLEKVRQEVLPPDFQAYVDKLRDQFGKIYVLKVKASREKTTLPRYQIVVTANPALLRPAMIGLLEEMEFTVTPDETEEEEVKVDASSIEAHYGGIEKLDSPMLFEGMRLLRQRIGLTGTPIDWIVLMTKIHTTAVDEDQSIHFLYDLRPYRVYRDEAGNVQLEDEIEALKNKLFEKVENEINHANQARGQLDQEIGQARVELEEKLRALEGEVGAAVARLQEVIRNLEEILPARGLTPETQEAIEKYLEAMKPYLDPENPEGLDSQKKAYVRFLEITILGSLEDELRSWNQYLQDLQDYRGRVEGAESLGALQELEKNFPVRQEPPIFSILRPPHPVETLQAHLEKGNDLLERARSERVPPAVEAYVDKLQDELGKVYVVAVERSPEKITPARYFVTVKVNSALMRPAMIGLLELPGQLHSMSFEITAFEGQIIDGSLIDVLKDTIKANYHERPAIDGAMLFEGMSQLTGPQIGGDPDPVTVIEFIAKIQVTAVDLDGTIHFNHKNEPWKIYRNVEGNVRVERDRVEKRIAPTPQEAVQLKNLKKVITFDTLTALMEGKEILSRHFHFTAKGPGTAQLEFRVDPCAESGPESCMIPAFKATVRITVSSAASIGREKPTKGLTEIDLKKGVQNVTLYLGDSLKINAPKGSRVGYLNRASEKSRQIIAPWPPIWKLPVITPLPTKPPNPALSNQKKKKRKN